MGASRRSPRPHIQAKHPWGVLCSLSTRKLEGQGLQAADSPGTSFPDHLLADAYSGHDGSPEMQPAPQNKRRLSLVSNGRYEGSPSEEVAIGKPAGEGPQPRVYTISGEPALSPGPEAEAIELAVVKGRRHREQHPHHHSPPLRASCEDVSTPCRNWAGGHQCSTECPGCAQLAPGPSPRAFGLDQPPLPQATGRRKKLERMYSVDRVSGEGPVSGTGKLGSASSSHCEAWAGGGCPDHGMQVASCHLVPCPMVGFGSTNTKSVKECFPEEGPGRILRVEQAENMP